LSRAVADLTIDELVALVRRAVRAELDSKRARARTVAPAPAVQASPEAIAKVRRRLRRQGVAA